MTDAVASADAPKKRPADNDCDVPAAPKRPAVNGAAAAPSASHASSTPAIGVSTTSSQHSDSPLPLPHCKPPGSISIPNDTATIRLSAVVSEDKGARAVMEDVAVILLDARPDPVASLPGVRLSFVGVFDGHGGTDCVQAAANSLHSNTLAAGLTQVARTCCVEGGKAGSRMDVKAAKQAIMEGFRLTDEALLASCQARGWQDGACAVTAWVLGDTALVANVGDAKAVLARTADKAGPGFAAGSLRGLLLSKDHLALHPAERARIEKAGGQVTKDGRLAGRLQVSRSFGDLAVKKLGCSSAPDIAGFQLTRRDKFLLMACDGFWGVFDAQGAVDMASALLEEGREPKAVTNRLLNEAIRVRGCKDNCTVLLLVFHHAPA
ncbi:hypothetical protein V8C86DRAFT_2873365 [Haematococcus lacustris]